MSVISADELIDEVKPWDKDSWKKFLESNIVPIYLLADTVARQFTGDPSAEVARALSDNAKRVLDVAKNIIGEVKVEFEAPSDPIESLRQLVEKCGNTFLGVGEAGKYALLAWSLRKVTKEYLYEALYPTLKDEEKRKETFKILGINEEKPIFIPAVKSPLTENLTVLGYTDYLSMCHVEEWGSYITLSILPAREATLGGSLCRLIDGIVAVLSRPGILSGVELSADVVRSYLDKCPARPTELYEYSFNKIAWRNAYRELGELSRQRNDYPYSVQGFAVRCVDYLYSPDRWDHARQETNLLSFFRWLMSGLVTGRLELLLSSDWRVGLLLERTV
jgi:hypothetical protein